MSHKLFEKVSNPTKKKIPQFFKIQLRSKNDRSRQNNQANFKRCNAKTIIFKLDLEFSTVEIFLFGKYTKKSVGFKTTALRSNFIFFPKEKFSGL